MPHRGPDDPTHLPDRPRFRGITRTKRGGLGGLPATRPRQATPPPTRFTIGLQGANIPEGLGQAAAGANFPWPGQFTPEGLGLPSASPWVMQTRQFMNARNQLLQQQAAAGGGFGGGGGGGFVDTTLKPLHEIKWQQTSLDLKGARPPSWWVALTPQDAGEVERPDVQYLMMLNTLIPYMSPEDQRRAAATLYSTSADAFSFYKPERISVDIPASDLVSTLTGVGGIDRPYFESAQRSQGAIDALSQMREKTVQGNRWKLGPGYTWLQQLLGSLQEFGAEPGGRQTRSDYLRSLGQLDPLLAQARSPELGPVGVLGEMLAQPFFSGGMLRPRTQVDSTMRFGAANPLFFT